MRKLFFALLLLLMVFSCTKTQKNYASISGKLENNKDSVISILGRSGLVKTMVINEDGSFSDTLNIPKAEIYTFQTSKTKRAPVFLKNGYEISINGDANNFLESFTYSGNGAENTQFILAQMNISRRLGNPADILKLEESAFEEKISAIKKTYDSILNSYKDLDSTLINMASSQNSQMVDFFKKTYANNKLMGKGKPSPKFENYVDYKGGKKSLDSFKGKYVYIDVWATWCGPCIQQIPYLKELEKEFHNKKIAFVSISTDESRRSGGSWEAAEKKWRNFVKERNLSGVQLWSGQDFSFQQAYQISGIPRFILIDSEGNIVDANAPRPSDPRLKQLFNSLNI